MTQSTMQTIYKMFGEAPHIKDYTFEHNSETNKLDIIHKANSICHTRHTDSIRELIQWYDKSLMDYDGQYGVVYETFEEYAAHYGIGFHEYVKLLRITLDEFRETNPEYFV